MHTLTILQAALKNPADVATICPSSSSLTQALVDRECIRNAGVVVDLGPGTGCTTRAILEQVSRRCTVLAVELTSEFITPLRALNDSRLHVVEGDAQQLSTIIHQYRLERPSVIISGLPFSTMPKATSPLIMQQIYQQLTDDGVFIGYQFRSTIAELARPLFGEPIAKTTVWWNLPPLKVFTWRK